jgi:RNA polymerase sigma factor (sigma-70 family)
MPLPPDAVEEAECLSRARAGDNAAFDRLLAPRRRQLHAHCYRMLGSPFDADDALQETLLAAWRGLAGFESRSALGTWLYRIATHVCLRLISQRPRRITSPDHGAPLQATAELGEAVAGPVWLEPLPDEEWIGHEEDPAATLLRREHVALAFVAALQHLPGTQRAVLLLREVLEYSAAKRPRCSTPRSRRSTARCSARRKR